ncbi:MAG TPA: PIN domain-containing protein, partial [Bdellovibrionota bacterium]|nr:PIN domain-containing protein [Bdellovibrionota bacterium]
MARGSSGMLNLDTHILIYALNGELNPKEQKLLQSEEWGISDIVLWEVTKLSQLKRIDIDMNDREVERVLSKIQTWPIDLKICQALLRLDFKSDPVD